MELQGLAHRRAHQRHRVPEQRLHQRRLGRNERGLRTGGRDGWGPAAQRADQQLGSERGHPGRDQRGGRRSLRAVGHAGPQQHDPAGRWPGRELGMVPGPAHQRDRLRRAPGRRVGHRGHLRTQRRLPLTWARHQAAARLWGSSRGTRSRTACSQVGKRNVKPDAVRRVGTTRRLLRRISTSVFRAYAATSAMPGTTGRPMPMSMASRSAAMNTRFGTGSGAVTLTVPPRGVWSR